MSIGFVILFLYIYLIGTTGGNDYSGPVITAYLVSITAIAIASH